MRSPAGEVNVPFLERRPSADARTDCRSGRLRHHPRRSRCLSSASRSPSRSLLRTSPPSLQRVSRKLNQPLSPIAPRSPSTFACNPISSHRRRPPAYLHRICMFHCLSQLQIPSLMSVAHRPRPPRTRNLHLTFSHCLSFGADPSISSTHSTVTAPLAHAAISVAHMGVSHLGRAYPRQLSSSAPAVPWL